MSTSSDFQDAKAKVLAILKREAPKRVSTWQLIDETHHSRAAGRVWDLINLDGYQIEHTKDGRIHYWRWIADPGPKQAGLFEGAA